jgi:hypothetical protein
MIEWIWCSSFVPVTKPDLVCLLDNPEWTLIGQATDSGGFEAEFVNKDGKPSPVSLWRIKWG